MTKSARKDGRFFAWFALIEGSAIILAIAAWYFLHQNLVYLFGSVVIISLVGSTYLLPKVLTKPPVQDQDERS